MPAAASKNHPGFEPLTLTIRRNEKGIIADALPSGLRPEIILPKAPNDHHEGKKKGDADRHLFLKNCKSLLLQFNAMARKMRMHFP